MMSIRLIELHRVLKSSGSIYLHCDPTASHYLKIIMDAIFSPRNFRNEIIWRRTNSHNKTTRQFGPIHDILLFCSKSDDFIFHPGTRPYFKNYIESRFKYSDYRGIYQLNYLTGPEVRTGESGLPWRGFNPTAIQELLDKRRPLFPSIPDTYQKAEREKKRISNKGRDSRLDAFETEYFFDTIESFFVV